MRSYRYLVVRDDLPLGIIASQLAHAAGDSPSRPDPGVQVWVVVLAVHSENELLAIAARLESRSVAHALVREPDLADSATAIGVHIVDSGVGRSRVRKVLSNLPLFGRNSMIAPDGEDDPRCEGCASPAIHTMQGWICSRTNQTPRTCSSRRRALSASVEGGPGATPARPLTPQNSQPGGIRAS